MSAAIFIDLLLLVGITGFGILLALVILRSPNWLEVISLAFPLGAGGFTWSLFVISWAGVMLTRQVVIFSLALLLLTTAILWVRRESGKIRSRLQQGWRKPSFSLPSFLSWTPLVTLLMLVALAIVIAIGIGYSTWDAIAIWSTKGYGVALTGSVLEARNWGAHGSAYPLNVPLLVTSFRLLGGDLLPVSKAVFPLLWASTLLGIYAFWRREKTGSVLASLGVLFLATVPVMFLHGTIGYANIPLASYIVLGALWGTVGIMRSDKSAQIVSGILLGLGAWTRVEGVLFSVSVIVALLAARLISKQGRIDFRAWLAPFATIAGVWLVFFGSLGAEGSQANSAMRLALSSFLEGDFGLGALGTIGRYVVGRSIEWSLWGLLFPIGLALIVLNWRKLVPREHPVSFALLLSAALTGVASVALFYVGSFFSPDLYGWLTRSFPRAFFQTAYLVGALAVLLAGQSLQETDEVAPGASDSRARARSLT